MPHRPAKRTLRRPHAYRGMPPEYQPRQRSKDAAAHLEMKAIVKRWKSLKEAGARLPSIRHTTMLAAEAIRLMDEAEAELRRRRIWQEDAE